MNTMLLIAVAALLLGVRAARRTVPNPQVWTLVLAVVGIGLALFRFLESGAGRVESRRRVLAAEEEIGWQMGRTVAEALPGLRSVAVVQSYYPDSPAERNAERQVRGFRRGLGEADPEVTRINLVRLDGFVPGASDSGVSPRMMAQVVERSPDAEAIVSFIGRASDAAHRERPLPPVFAVDAAPLPLLLDQIRRDRLQAVVTTTPTPLKTPADVAHPQASLFPLRHTVLTAANAHQFEEPAPEESPP